MGEEYLKRCEEELIDIANKITRFPLEPGEEESDDLKITPVSDWNVGILLKEVEGYQADLRRLFNIITDTNRFLNPDFLFKETMNAIRVKALADHMKLPQFSEMTIPDSEMGITRN